MSQEAPEASETPPATAAVRPAPAAKPRIGKLRVLLLGVGALVFLLAFFIVAYSAFGFLESTTFCSVCHNMKPEVVAHDSSPHARTGCGTCHVGPGVLAGIKAKLENARYVYLYPFNLYPRPIPSPIKSLRPVEVVCEQCHWPQKFYNDRLVIRSNYASDEANSLTRTQLLLRTGGGTRAEGLGRGIHWHIENPVYYIATDDKRQNIPWCRRSSRERRLNMCRWTPT
jgi:hypothetical protein